MLKQFKLLMDKIKELNKEPVMKILPGQLAFFFILSIPPLISLVGIIGSLFSIPTGDFINFISNSFPASTSNLIIPIINDNGLNISILIFVIGAFLMISKGTNAIILTSNILYNVDDDNNIKQTIKALFLVFMIVILLAFIIVVPAFGDLIMELLQNIGYLDDIYDELMLVYNIIKLPTSFVFIYFVIKIIYTIAPNREIKSRDVTFGAIFTTTLWIVSSEVYSYYITNYATYSLFYGSIANLIILLLWMYLLSYIFVLGMALNAGSHSLEFNKKKKP
jgi:membrane protein